MSTKLAMQCRHVFFSDDPGVCGTVFIVLVVFLANQFFEFMVILIKGISYSDLCIWDCGWYSYIVENGYDIEPHAHVMEDAANWAFFPVVPIVAMGVKKMLLCSSNSAMLITSKMFFLFSIYAFVHLSRIYEKNVSPWIAASVVTFQPYAIYGNAGYTESMFLLMTCVFFIALHRDKFLLAGLVGGVLGAVRLVGVFVGLSYCVRVWSAFWASEASERWRLVAGGLLIPLGVSLFMVWLYWLAGDALAFVHIQRAWGRTILGPWGSFVAGMQGDYPEPLWALTALFGLVTCLYYAMTKRLELSVFSLLCVLVPLAAGVLSMPRFVFWQAPVLLFMARAVMVRKVYFVIIPLSIVVWIGMTFLWISGDWRLI